MSTHLRDAAAFGALVLACKAWYDIMSFLHTRERLRVYTSLIEKGVDLVNLAIESNQKVTTK